MTTSKKLSTAIAIIILALLGWYFYPTLQSGSSQDSHRGLEPTQNGVVQDNSGKEVLYWYDPMVPTQRFDKPGKSPFMDMELVPKYAEADGGGVIIPSTTLQNLAIRTSKVEMATFGEEISTVGRIVPNERLFYSVQTRVPGFIDRLLVRAEGDPVQKNQKIAEIYSPELLSAQKEYLALLNVTGLQNSESLAEAARARLKLLGMTKAEIDNVTSTGQATTRIGVYSPATGIVAKLGVREGEQLVSGSSLMEIVDLSKVWLIAEVPERDAGLIRIGATAVVELQSQPGQSVKGEVSYLYPTLDETTRALRVRVELTNRKGEFLPGMYANVRLRQQAQQALAVPAESVIDTGRRRVVIVKEERGFRPAQVETGRQANGKTEILQGLQAGDFVVSSGQFLIDSEASLSGVLDRLSQQPGSQADMQSMSNVTDAIKLFEGVGKVKIIDLSANEVTLAHDPIPEIEWPSMTMAFQVQDPQLLNKVRVGDHVNFSFSIVNDGEAYVIEQMHPINKMQSGAGS